MAGDRHEFRPGTGYLVCYGATLVAVTGGLAFISFSEAAVRPEDRTAITPWLFWLWLPVLAVLTRQFWRLAILRRPTLVIDRDGFSLDEVFAAVGRIEWAEVDRAMRLTQRNRDKITIATRDPKLPAQRRSLIGRIITWGDGGPGPIEITRAMVGDRLDEVQRLILAHAGTGKVER